MAPKRKNLESFDQTDEAIIHCIEADPKMLLKSIPDALKKTGSEELSYSQIQRRVDKLSQSGVVERGYSINWKKAGYLVRYRVGILIDPVVLRNERITKKKYNSQHGLAHYILEELLQDERLREQFQGQLVIDDVYILLGGKFDLAVDFVAKDDQTATEFIIDALRGLPGINNTVSAKMAYSSKRGWLSSERRRLGNLIQ